MNGNYYNNFYPREQTNEMEEQSYIENLLRINRGALVKIHITVPGSKEWQDRVFEGIIEQAGKDHVIMSNPETGEWSLILLIYIDFVTFREPIKYNKQFYN